MCGKFIKLSTCLVTCLQNILEKCRINERESCSLLSKAMKGYSNFFSPKTRCVVDTKKQLKAVKKGSKRPSIKKLYYSRIQKRYEAQFIKF